MITSTPVLRSTLVDSIAKRIMALRKRGKKHACMRARSLTGVEEVRRDPPGLEREGPEEQHLRVQRKLDELPLVGLQPSLLCLLLLPLLLPRCINSHAELLRRRPGVARFRDAPRDGQQQLAAGSRKAGGACALKVPALGADAWLCRRVQVGSNKNVLSGSEGFLVSLGADSYNQYTRVT